MPVPSGLLAPGADTSPFQTIATVPDLPPGTLLRVTRGDHDVLLAHTDAGLVATDDRCPHMSAPLSIGRLEGCFIDCPLHAGRFDLSTGETVRFPTTGGLDAEGRYHPTWSPPDAPPKLEPPGPKAQARSLTRVRRMRYYRVRLEGDRIEVALPVDSGSPIP
ncbi:hypothetical protein BH20CHL6_BH20CHL6_16830 [soil metagenome]